MNYFVYLGLTIWLVLLHPDMYFFIKYCLLRWRMLISNKNSINFSALVDILAANLNLN